MSVVALDANKPTQKDLEGRSPETLIRYIRILQLQIAAERAAKETPPAERQAE